METETKIVKVSTDVTKEMYRTDPGSSIFGVLANSVRQVNEMIRKMPLVGRPSGVRVVIVVEREVRVPRH